MRIGYVISDENIDLGHRFKTVPYIDYNRDEHAPCLFIGMKETRLKLGIDTDVTDRVIDKNTFWTFTVDEHRSYHESDVFDFKEYCYKNLISGANYYFIDPFTMGKEKSDRVLEKIKNNPNDKISLITDNMVYILLNDTVFGINLTFYEFINGSTDDLLRSVKDFSKTVTYKSEILSRYPDFVEEYRGDLKYMPIVTVFDSI